MGFFMDCSHFRGSVNKEENTMKHTQGEKMGLIFLDTQKAFDNINWNFMLQLMEDMNFGPKPLEVIKGIYHDQKGRIRVNSDFTEEIEISQGTRQGCPLSPLLFVMTLEMLNNIIREDPRIKGLKVQKEEYKVQAYADNMMIILEEPRDSLLHLIEILQLYSKVASLEFNKKFF